MKIISCFKFAETIESLYKKIKIKQLWETISTAVTAVRNETTSDRIEYSINRIMTRFQFKINGPEI